MAWGGAVIELRQREGPPDAFQNLAAICGQDYFSVACAPADPATHVHAADLVVNPQRLDAALAAIAERSAEE
jgi:hypothetical protein